MSLNLLRKHVLPSQALPQSKYLQKRFNQSDLSRVFSVACPVESAQDPNIEVFAKLRASISIKDQYICATCPLAKECEYAFQKKTQEKIDFDINYAVAFLKKFIGSEDGYIKHLLDARHQKVNTLDTTTSNHFVYWSATLRITDTLSAIEKEVQQNEEFIRLNQVHDQEMQSQLAAKAQNQPSEAQATPTRQDRRQKEDDIKPKGESEELYKKLKQFDRPSNKDRPDRRENSQGDKFKFRESSERVQTEGGESEYKNVKDWNKKIDQEFGGKPRGQFENRRNDRDSFKSFEREQGQARQYRDGGESRERYNNREGQSSSQRSERYNPDRSSRYNDIDKRERYNQGGSDRGGDRQNRGERYERSNRGDRYERPERTERYERPERTERNERTQNYSRGERTERTERTERYERSERPQQREGQQRERYIPEKREDNEGQKQQYHPGNRYPKLEEQSQPVEQKQGSPYGKPKYGRGRGAGSKGQSDGDDE